MIKEIREVLHWVLIMQDVAQEHIAEPEVEQTQPVVESVSEKLVDEIITEIPSVPDESESLVVEQETSQEKVLIRGTDQSQNIEPKLDQKRRIVKASLDSEGPGSAFRKASSDTPEISERPSIHMNKVAPETTDQLEQDSTEMVFSVTGSRQIGLAIDKPATQVCDFLSHHIARQPEDLLAHVQRIKLAAQHGLENYLRGGLTDLFIALGGRGETLRELMLTQAQAVLSEDDRALFRQALENGVDASTVFADPGVSVLSSGISGRTDFIDAPTLAEASHLGPLEQALTNIEASQLAEAREVLETSVLAGTSDREQQELLLDLYRKTDDHVHFATLFANLEDDHNHAPEAWRALKSHFDANA